MFNSKLMTMIEANSQQMADKWREGMKSSEFSKTYRKLSDAELERRGKDVYDNLSKWLDRDTTIQQIDKNYTELGKQRYHEGFPLCEVFFALHHTKQVLWNHILSEGILTSALEIYQVMDLIVRVYNFFDIASFFIVRGYMEELFQHVNRLHGVDHEKLKGLFHLSTFLSDYHTELY